MRAALICVVALLSAVPATASDRTVATPASAKPYNYKPAGGYVSKPEVAIAIGEIVLKSIYGDRVISNEEPLTARLTADGVWIVRGSMKPAPRGAIRMGGVAEIWIAKSDGRIVRVLHGE